jgi:2-aminoadipate transaminase
MTATMAKASHPSHLVVIERDGPVPLFQQIADSIETLVRAGRFRDGDRLPPVRGLADQLGVNSLTVSRAYRDLGARGLVAGRGPLGTFITAPGEGAGRETGAPGDALVWKSRFPEDTFRQMLETSGLPGTISLSQAYPTAAGIDLAPFHAAIARALEDNGPALYGYQAPDGAPMLKDALREILLADQPGMDGPMIVTSGGQQAIAMVMRGLVRPGDTVLFERPSYFGALDVARSQGARIMGIDMEPDGLCLDQLEHALRETNPSLLVLMPNFQNPTGITTSLEKRHAILELTRRYQVAVLEDDHAPEMRYRGDPLPALKTLAGPEDRVFYARGLSKSYIPGIRLGFLLPPRSYYQDMASQKSMADLHTSLLLQYSFAHYLRTPHARANVERQRAIYGALQDVVMERLAITFPSEIGVVLPDGGFNLWLQLPEAVDSIDLCWASAQRGVSLLVGAPLFADVENYGSIRLSFGLGDRDLLLEGIDRVGAAVRDIVSAPRSARMSLV